MIAKPLRVNERIRVNQIRLIGDNGAQLGIMTPQEGMTLAREAGVDLVEVAPQATPPVCRLLNFNKFKYEQAKQDRATKRKHHVAKLKEMKFKPRIERHDYQTKLGQLKRFLARGDKAKVTMVFRGREMRHLEIGRRVLDRVVEDLKAVARVERTPILEGRFMTMVFCPDQVAMKRAEKAAQAARPATRATASAADPATGDTSSPARKGPARPAAEPKGGKK